MCSLQEYDLHYSLKDLVDANEALDIRDEFEAWSERQAAKQMPKAPKH